MERIPILSPTPPPPLHSHFAQQEDEWGMDDWEDMVSGEQPPPRRLLEMGCQSLGVVAFVVTCWIVIVCVAVYEFRMITTDGYLHMGPGASEDDIYPFTPEAAIALQQECIQDRNQRDTIAQGGIALLQAKLTTTNDTLGVLRQLLVVQNTAYQVPVSCIPPPPLGPKPTVVTFLGAYISTWYTWGTFIGIAFIGSIVSGYAGNTAGIYLSNVIQDSDTIDIPYSEWQIQVYAVFLTLYWRVSNVVELQISFAGVDYLGVVSAGSIIFGLFLIHAFMEEKRRKRKERRLMRQRQRMAQLQLVVNEQDQLQQHQSLHPHYREASKRSKRGGSGGIRNLFGAPTRHT